jgi:hypothetical protein
MQVKYRSQFDTNSKYWDSQPVPLEEIKTSEEIMEVYYGGTPPSWGKMIRPMLRDLITFEKSSKQHKENPCEQQDSYWQKPNKHWRRNTHPKANRQSGNDYNRSFD